VAVMHNDVLSYAPGFDEALTGLLEKESGTQLSAGEELTGEEDLDELIQRANEAFNNYLEQMNSRDFRNAGNSLEQLQESLEKLTEKSNKND
jgi:uncharacterized membrane protein (UPF0182 family)